MGAGGGVAPTHNVIGGREFPLITWWQEPKLRQLYFLLGTVILVSATNGFDGSMMNGLQAVKNWENCMFSNIFPCSTILLTNWQTSSPPLPNSVFSMPLCLLVLFAPCRFPPSWLTGGVAALPSLLVSLLCLSVLLCKLLLRTWTCSLVPVTS